MKLPRNAQQWFPGWLAARKRNRSHRFDTTMPVTVWLLLADHFEPYVGNASQELARHRVAEWATKWPEIANHHQDDLGRPARWTFFYPQDEYDPEIIDTLAVMARTGVGEVEVHIHHDGEGEEIFVSRLGGFVETLRRGHGLLHELNGRPGFAFIHGNWALDNASPDGRWCGLNNELSLLRKLGCYADFTMPCAPNPCQTRIVNAIYWAIDDPQQPKSHDHGTLVEVGAVPPAGGLLCVQGPLTIRRHPTWRLIPSLQTDQVDGPEGVSLPRTERWLDAAPRIGNNVFLKLHTHGAGERCRIPLLDGGGADALFASVREACARRQWKLLHTTPFEMYHAIEAARLGTDAAASVTMRQRESALPDPSIAEDSA